MGTGGRPYQFITTCQPKRHNGHTKKAFYCDRFMVERLKFSTKDKGNGMNWIKTAVSTVCGFVLSILGNLFVPVMLLVGCNLIDYVTGITASIAKGEKVSSKKGIKGIVKKVCMWLLIVVGAIVDQTIKVGAGNIGINLTMNGAVALIVTIWLIMNEIISILENMVTIGVPVPGFLVKMCEWIEKKAEKAGDDIIPKEEE